MAANKFVPLHFLQLALEVYSTKAHTKPMLSSLSLQTAAFTTTPKYQRGDLYSKEATSTRYFGITRKQPNKI